MLGTCGDQKRVPLKLRAIAGSELLCGCWEPKPSLLLEQQVVFTAGHPSFSPSQADAKCCLQILLHFM